MDWPAIISAAICGAAGAGIAELAVHWFKLKRGLGYTLLLGVIFAGLNGFSRQVILPEVREWQAGRLAERMPIYQAARRLEPGMAAELEKLFASVARGGDGSGQARANLRSTISKLAMKHAPKASDESIVALVTVTVENMETLAAVDPKLCFDYLFPRPGEWHDFSRHLSKGAAEREVAVLGDVLMSAAEHPQSAPREKDVLPAFEGVVRRLQRQFGSETLELLGNAQKYPTEARKICSISMAMYKEILALPKAQQGPALRYLFVASGERTSPNKVDTQT